MQNFSTSYLTKDSDLMESFLIEWNLGKKIKKKGRNKLKTSF